jgi:hypothetical protein
MELAEDRVQRRPSVLAVLSRGVLYRSVDYI